MLKMIKRILKIVYIKWVKGECRKICITCKYKNECFDNIEYEKF